MSWDREILSLIGAIGREAGKNETTEYFCPEECDRLVEIAKIQSTESSNMIEGIVTTSVRMRQILVDRTTPRNRDEMEIAGYRDVLDIIHNNFNEVPITPNYILQMHQYLYKHMDNPMSGRTKNVQNYITATYPDGRRVTLFTPMAPFETPEALQHLCDGYNRVIGNNELDPLIAIPVFIHDFLCIHPFNDGNGRMSRLLTTLLLYRAGFFIGRYISLEAKIAKNKDLYYSAIRNSEAGWYDGENDPTPFIKFLLGTILSAYKDLSERVAIVDSGLPAIDMVRKAVSGRIGRFTKQDILALCPSLSLSSVEGALRKLVEMGEIEREGVSRAIKYKRLA